jgi:uncharacterized repeat protein (TIGR03803 family)
MFRVSYVPRKSFLCCAFSLAIPIGIAHAKTVETVLHAFQGGSDGASPQAGLIADKAGNLYGTTYNGGGTGCFGGCGTIFRLAPDGTLTVLYAFQGGSDGEYPPAGLISDKAGDLYGTTSEGGGTGCYDNQGCGTVFKLASDGTFTVLHTFAGGSDGGQPEAGLIIDKTGNLYGTTYIGGGNTCAVGGGCGIVFKLAPDGTETVLHAFCARKNCDDGASPWAGLIADKNGSLFGTTLFGGGGRAGCFGKLGCGTVFKLAPDGTETALYSFCPQKKCTDGAVPQAGLIRDDNGNLYGTTTAGGAYCEGGDEGDGCGTVFKLARDGTETVLHSFTGHRDGSTPDGTLIADQNGNLYGTTFYGDSRSAQCQIGCGTAFRLASDGTLTVLHNFDGGSDGGGPMGGVILDSAGNLYGTTFEGGGADCSAFYLNGCGIVFKLNK